jgi:hypothetical protein
MLRSFFNLIFNTIFENLNTSFFMLQLYFPFLRVTDVNFSIFGFALIFIYLFDKFISEGIKYACF